MFNTAVLYKLQRLRSLPLHPCTGMHEQAESGGAAHAAYKGGLDAQQVQRLQSWMQSLQALPLPGVTSSAQLLDKEQAWSNQAAAAEQLFRYAGLCFDSSCYSFSVCWFWQTPDQVVCRP